MQPGPFHNAEPRTREERLTAQSREKLEKGNLRSRRGCAKKTLAQAACASGGAPAQLLARSPQPSQDSSLRGVRCRMAAAPV